MDFPVCETGETFYSSVNLSLQLLSSRKPSSNGSSKAFNFHILGLKISVLSIHSPKFLGNWESTTRPAQVVRTQRYDFNAGAGAGGNQALSWKFLLYHHVSVHLLYMYINWEFFCVYLACWPSSFKWSWHSFIQKNVPPPPLPLQMSATKPRVSRFLSPTYRLPQLPAMSQQQLSPSAMWKRDTQETCKLGFLIHPQMKAWSHWSWHFQCQYQLLKKDAHFKRQFNSLRHSPLCTEMSWQLS